MKESESLSFIEVDALYANIPAPTAAIPETARPIGPPNAENAEVSLFTVPASPAIFFPDEALNVLIRVKNNSELFLAF